MPLKPKAESPTTATIFRSGATVDAAIVKPSAIPIAAVVLLSNRLRGLVLLIMTRPLKSS
jgi:hypothetical protein